MTDPSAPQDAPPGFLGTLREMAWAFVGVRDRRNYERTTRAKPWHIVAAGLILTAGFILGLLMAVHFALRALGA